MDRPASERISRHILHFGTTIKIIVGEGKAMLQFNQNGPPPRAAAESTGLSLDQLRQKLLALILKNEALRKLKPR
jgi:hypothetical protein